MQRGDEVRFVNGGQTWEVASVSLDGSVNLYGMGPSYKRFNWVSTRRLVHAEVAK